MDLKKMNLMNFMVKKKVKNIKKILIKHIKMLMKKHEEKINKILKIYMNNIKKINKMRNGMKLRNF
jgi:hypothetical protein